MNIFCISIALDVFCALISLILLIFLGTEDSKRTRLSTLFIFIVVFSMVRYICDAIAWFSIGNRTGYSFVLHSTAEFLNYFFQYLLIGVYADYIISLIGKKAKTPPIIVRTLYIMCGVAVLMLVVSQFNHMYYYIDENNVYHRQPLFMLSQVFQFVGLFVSIGIIVRHRSVFHRRERISLLLYLALPIIGTIAQGMHYGLPYGNVSTLLAMLVIYMGIQSEQAKLLKQQELELINARVGAMLSQIQPHFMFNSLEAIQDLCEQEGAPRAESAVKEFSQYLRVNLDSLSYQRPVAFAKELEHARIYLSLEKKRFEERLNIVFDIQTEEDFRLPALSLQSIVENSVRHSITKRNEGGTITIRVVEEESRYVITVCDDGIGFRADAPKKSAHVGIENVRDRLEAMCDGTLEIKSTPGVGTVAIISIPKKGDKL